MMGKSNWPLRAGTLMVCLWGAGEALAAERTVARMGELRASVSASNWCGPIVRVDVEAPSGAQLDPNTRELQLLIGGVRQILTLECPAVQELELTGLAGGQVAGHWRHRSDGQLVAMAPPATPDTPVVPPMLPPTGPVTTAHVAKAQRLLSELGYQPGPADGLVGQRTRTAIAAFMVDRQLPYSDRVNHDLLAQLHLARCGNPVGCEQGESAIASSQAPMVGSRQNADTSQAAAGVAQPSGPLVAPALPGAAPVGGSAQASVEASAMIDAGQASAGGAASASTRAPAMPPSHDYQAMAQRLGLRMLKGLPVLTGSSGVLSEEQAKASVRLLDLAALGATPEHVENDPQCWAQTYLSEAEQPAFLGGGWASGSMEVWRGDNEFERARAREGFLEQHGERLRSQAVAFPLEFMMVQKTRLQGYDQGTGGFPLSGIAPSVNGLGDIERMLGAGRHRPACAIRALKVSAPAVQVPEVWRMPPERAEQVLQRLSERSVHVAIGVRLREMPIDEDLDPRLNYRRIPLWAEVTSIAAYEDPDLERLIEDFGVSSATAPVLLTGLPEALSFSEPALPDQVTLDEESLALVILRDHGDVLSDTAWRLLLSQQSDADQAYYERRYSRDTGSQRFDVERSGFDPRYTPFFPKGERYRQNNDFSAEKMALFKEWAMLRASRLPEALNLRIGISARGNEPAAIGLPVMAERRDTARLVEWFGEQGYSTHQVLQPDLNPIGVGIDFDPAIMAGPGIKRRPFLVLPNLASRYVPDVSQQDAERILGGPSGRHVMELALRIDGSEFVTLDERNEALVVSAEPVGLYSHDRTGSEVVYRHEYEVPDLASERQEVASSSTVVAPEGPLPLTSEVMDLLMVRHVPEAVSDADYLMMLEARWTYEDSLPLGGAEPEWGRFFVPGRAKPDEAGFAERLEDFKAWTLARTEAMPETFTLYQAHVPLGPDRPLELLGSRNLAHGPIELQYASAEIRSCRHAAQNREALTPACDYLESVLSSTSHSYPLGLGYQTVGPRVSCGMALRRGRSGDPETAYCKARRELFEKVGTNNVEPGFRDILVLDKEVVFAGTQAEADAASGAGVLVEFAVRGARVETQPLPVRLVEASRRIMAYQQALGWDENFRFTSNNSTIREMLGYQPPRARPGTSGAAPPERYFVFEAELRSAGFVNKGTGEWIDDLALREPPAFDLAALEVPDAQALSSPPDAPYGPDVLGIQLGMSIDEAEAIIRDHMTVGHVLVRDRKLDPRFASGEFETFSSSRLFVADDMSELIVLYDEPPVAEGVVMGVTRQLAFPKGQVTTGLLLGELRKKYGEENWSDENHLKVGWGDGFASARPSDLRAHPCMPEMRQMRSNGRDPLWALEDGSSAESVTGLAGKALTIPGISLASRHALQGRECGVSLVLDSSAPGEEHDLFSLHLTDPNRYLRVHARSQEIVKSGESGAEGQTVSLEIKL
ncbi:hypothetical protein C6V82_06055 [Halomonas urumqiensis]|nr:hypothetical protein C6V82_06055 [Halomonas urumqiensis]